MISNIFGPIFGIFKHHKLKVGTFLGTFIVMTYLLFPFNDLADFVGGQISRMSQGLYSLDFDTMDVSVLPQPGLEFSDVQIQTSMTNPIPVQRLTISPSLPSLLAFKIGFTSNLENVLGGNLTLTQKEGEKTKEPKIRKQKFDVELDSISLEEIFKVLDMNVLLKGKLQADAAMDLDPLFNDQPSGKLSAHADQFKTQDGYFTVQGMQINIPAMDLKTLDLDAVMDKGDLKINKLSLGTSNSDLNLNISGRASVKVLGAIDAATLNIGAYDLSIRMTVSESIKSKLFFLPLLGPYQVTPNTYSIKLSGNGLYAPPTMVKGM